MSSANASATVDDCDLTSILADIGEGRGEGANGEKEQGGGECDCDKDRRDCSDGRCLSLEECEGGGKGNASDSSSIPCTAIREACVARSTF